MSRTVTLEDCLTCGACCCNSDENRAEGYPWYVEIDTPKSPLLLKADLRKRYVVFDEEGTPHVRLDPSGRCAALVGALGAAVKCQIYPHRPKGCRLVHPGDPGCLQARRERGIGQA